MRKQDRWAVAFARSQKGSLSVTALWMLALLSLTAAGLARTILTGLRMESYELRSVEAAWLARAGINHAISVLLSETGFDSTSACDGLTGQWAHSPDVFKWISCGSGFFEVAYAPLEKYPGVSCLYGALDENRRINLNRAPAEVLLRLPGMNQEKLAALLDWRDRDDEPRALGAESAYYLAHHSYPCKNADLDFVEELALVLGFTDDAVRQLAPLVTTYGDGRVNINTAGAGVLETLGLRPQLAQSIAEARWGPDQVPFTADDFVFTSQFDIVGALKSKLMIHLAPEDELLMNRLIAQQLLGVASSHFTISSSGIAMDGQVRKEIKATVERVNRERVKILSWTEE